MFGLEMFAISHINGQFGKMAIYLIILNKKEQYFVFRLYQQIFMKLNFGYYISPMDE